MTAAGHGPRRLRATMALVGSTMALVVGCGGLSESVAAHDERWEGPPAPPAPPRCRWFGAPHGVHFRPGSATIDPDFQPESPHDPLRRVVDDHRSGGFERARVTGFVEHYCPSAPSDPALARERARAVIARLVALGLAEDAIDPPLTIAACCADVDDPCDPDVPHRLRIVQISYLTCHGSEGRSSSSSSSDDR